MPRTKKKESKQKSVAIQTDNLDSNVEIVRLQEQLKMLQLENDTLKKSVNSNTVSVKDFPDTSTVSLIQTPQRVNKNPKGNLQILRSATKPKMCTCKGNCSNKICGCVKNERKCGSMCKCDDQLCQNQEPENKENIPDIPNEIVYEAQKLENVHVERKLEHQSLFSPESTGNEVNLNNIKFEDIHFGTPKKSMYASNQELKSKNTTKVRNDLIKGRNKDKKGDEGVGDKKLVTTSKQTVKRIETSANENNENKAQEPDAIESEVIQKSRLSEEDDTNSIPEADTSFDPMKPKRQLLRTPPRGNTVYEPLNVSTDVATPTAVETSIEKIEQKMDTIPEELNKENVDLDKLRIELVSCKKCKRKFYPWRIEVHKDVCLGS